MTSLIIVVWDYETSLLSITILLDIIIQWRADETLIGYKDVICHECSMYSDHLQYCNDIIGIL